MAQRKSKYRAKLDKGDLMYGPGCCAHTLTPERMWSIRTARGTTRPGNRLSPYGRPIEEDSEQ